MNSFLEKPAVFQCEAPDKINLNGVPDLAEIVQNKKSIVFRETDIVEQGGMAFNAEL